LGIVQQGYQSYWNPFGESTSANGYEYDSFHEAMATDGYGNATVTIPTKALRASGRIELTAEARDESGRTVSSQADVAIYPASLEIGVSPDRWIGRLDLPSQVRVVTSNHDGTPRAGIPVHVDVVESTWHNGKSSAIDRGHVD